MSALPVAAPGSAVGSAVDPAARGRAVNAAATLLGGARASEARDLVDAVLEVLGLQVLPADGVVVQSTHFVVSWTSDLGRPRVRKSPTRAGALEIAARHAQAGPVVDEVNSTHVVRRIVG